MNAATLSIEQFRQHVQQQSAHPNPRLADLRRQSNASEEVRPAEPLTEEALDVTEHDERYAVRQRLKVFLAGNKLQTSLVVAALNRLVGEDELRPPPPVSVAAWVEQTAAWIQATTTALAQQWGSHAPGEGTAAPLALSAYHRYAVARTLVGILERHPTTAEQVTPDQMAVYLAVAGSGVPPEPATPAWIAVGANIERSLAWSRALARILETAVQTPFNRPLETVLADARTALAEAVPRQLEAIQDALALPKDAQQIVEQHILQTTSRLYAATLHAVHQESARLIERYQALQAAGDTEQADVLAQAYQDRRLGYAGVLHHFYVLLVAHTAQHAATLAAMAVEPSLAAPAPRHPPAASPANPSTDLARQRDASAVHAPRPVG